MSTITTISPLIQNLKNNEMFLYSATLQSLIRKPIHQI
jgi:hypothetical protein